MYRKRIGENKGISLILSTLWKIKARCQQSQEGIEDKFVPEAYYSETLLLIVDVMEGHSAIATKQAAQQAVE